MIETLAVFSCLVMFVGGLIISAASFREGERYAATGEFSSFTNLSVTVLILIQAFLLFFAVLGWKTPS